MKKYPYLVPTIILGACLVLIAFLFSGEAPTVEVPKETAQPLIDAEKVVDGVNTLIETRKNNKAKRLSQQEREDSIYFATREKDWVYLIGDIATNTDPLEDLFFEPRNTEKVCLFREKNNCFLFSRGPINKHLADSIEWYRVHFNKNIRIDSIDLNSQCEKGQALKEGDRVSFERGKKKGEIRCYTSSN